MIDLPFFFVLSAFALRFVITSLGRCDRVTEVDLRDMG